MKPFQILTLVLAGLLLIVTWMDYREKKNMNDYIMGKTGSKTPCKCNDHSDDSTTNLDTAPSHTDPALSAAML
ncbi:hypothetical protein [Aureispira anguillae]|uniref:Uncharacterized protein n=1 Tax=Aureispira anguillae TaxID=2864201 RepID=A0A915YBN6_9BACT|nr:hypothetical protein [Aureispira anguillae]BDS10099.1 hypothetical protein AsAng_0008060 [Aureispira anguillae]